MNNLAPINWNLNQFLRPSQIHLSLDAVGFEKAIRRSRIFWYINVITILAEVFIVISVVHILASNEGKEKLCLTRVPKHKGTKWSFPCVLNK